jgi:hypothetical protein
MSKIPAHPNKLLFLIKEIFGWDEMIFDLIHTISKPKEPSTMSNTRSLIFPMSISRFFLPLTTVIGPFASFNFFLHNSEQGSFYGYDDWRWIIDHRRVYD